jgi:hypothetical protein
VCEVDHVLALTGQGTAVVGDQNRKKKEEENSREASRLISSY